MSMNLRCVGWDLCQTPTDVSYALLDVGKAKVGTVLEKDLAVVEAYGNWLHAWLDPKPLEGKDARNSYLQNQRLEEIAETEAMVEALRTHVSLCYSDQKSLFRVV